MNKIKYKDGGCLYQKPVYVIFTDLDDGYRKNNSLAIILNDRKNESDVMFIASGQNDTLPNSQLLHINPAKTGDNFERKICNICYQVKSIDKFAKNQTNKNKKIVRRPSCEECRKGIDSRVIPPRIRQQWESKYGKPETGDLFLCPICEKKSIVYKSMDVVLDHHHRTGTPRGYICGSCNTGLGRFKNGHYFLERAKNYLDNHTEEETQ